MTEAYRVVLLEIDRKFLTGTDPESIAFQDTLQTLGRRGIVKFLVVPEQDGPGVKVIGKPGTVKVVRGTFGIGFVGGIRTIGLLFGGNDILYISNNDAGRAGVGDWIRFENVGPGARAANEKLVDVFTLGVRENRASLPTPPAPSTVHRVVAAPQQKGKIPRR